LLQIVFRAGVWTFVTWIEGFVSQGRGEGVLQIVFRAVVWTFVTWIEGFVLQGRGEGRRVYLWLV
jgi:hypothetical protein